MTELTPGILADGMKVSWIFERTAFGVVQNVTEKGFEVRWSDGVVDYTKNQSKYLLIL